VKNESDTECLEMIEAHLGQHCHEPTIARVLHEAASRGKYRIVQELLKDGVHPDVCVKMEDETAFNAAGSTKVQKLLYEQGAKVDRPHPFHPLTCWQGVYRINESHAPQLRQTGGELISNGIGNEQFRGLIVEIYSHNPSETDKNPKSYETDGESGSSKRADKLADHEFHRIAHPTVEELIKKGPKAIMEADIPPELSSDQYRRYRWIHIPMNHVS
jgi:hypothetical protein